MLVYCARENVKDIYFPIVNIIHIFIFLNKVWSANVNKIDRYLILLDIQNLYPEAVFLRSFRNRLVSSTMK
jgi:hypothetical protein